MPISLPCVNYANLLEAWEVLSIPWQRGAAGGAALRVEQTGSRAGLVCENQASLLASH